jgi:hypothetical protein
MGMSYVISIYSDKPTPEEAIEEAKGIMAGYDINNPTAEIQITEFGSREEMLAERDTDCMGFEGSVDEVKEHVKGCKACALRWLRMPHEPEFFGRA